MTDKGCHEHGPWTHEALHTHLESRINGLSVRMEDRHAAETRAATILSDVTAAKFESVNEFRAAMGDQASRFMTRDEASAQHQRMTDAIGVLQDRLNRAEGKGLGLNAGWLYALGAIAALGTLASMIGLFWHSTSGG